MSGGGFCRACRCEVKNWKRHMVSKKHRENVARLKRLDYLRRKHMEKSLEKVLEK